MLLGLFFSFLRLVERQERHDALPVPAVDDDFVGAAEHAFHGLEIHALACYFRRLFILLIHLQKARGLARRLGDGLFLISARALQDTLGVAARLRNNPVGI